MRICVEPYGCTMNRGEAGKAVERLLEMGYDVSLPEDGRCPDDADGIILFACVVIGSTERRMWRRIEEISASGRKLYVAGCMARVFEDAILDRYPGASVLDTMGLDSLNAAFEAEFRAAASGEDPDRKPPVVRRIDHIVPIATGCNGSCAYCITRLARGGVRSNPIRDVLESVRAGIRSGRREILVTSQDAAAYGLDMVQDGGVDIGYLLGAITGEVDGEYRIRVGMMNPGNLMRCLPSALDGFSDPRVFRFFHVPVQSGSDRILELMNRGYTVEEFISVVRGIRRRYPDATISTDVIVGFPGEDEGDFQASLDLIRGLKPDILNITRFSPRPGTPADRMPGRMVGWRVKERSRELTTLHEDILGRRLRERKGLHRGCLVTEVGRGKTMMARDSNYTPIVIDAPGDLLGSFVDIETHDAGPTYLKGYLDRSRPDGSRDR